MLMLVLLFVVKSGLVEANDLDYVKLVQTICHKRESQGVSPAIEPISPNRLDWGRCQINVDTAMWMGYGTSQKSFALLWNTQGSENAALELVVRIINILEKKNLPLCTLITQSQVYWGNWLQKWQEFLL